MLRCFFLHGSILFLHGPVMRISISDGQAVPFQLKVTIKNPF